MNEKDNPVNVPSMKIDKDDVRVPPQTSRNAAINPKKPESKTSIKGPSRRDWVALSIASIALSATIGLAVINIDQEEKIKILESLVTSHSMDIANVRSEQAELVEETETFSSFASSEIRKLWGVAYDRNRSAIASNTTAIARLESSLASTSDQVTAAARSAGASGTAVERLQAELMSKDILVSEANQRALLLGEIIEEQQLQLQNMADKIAELERSNAISENELKTRIEENEEMMNGFNAYRQSVNRQLNELRTQVAAPAGQ